MDKGKARHDTPSALGYAMPAEWERHDSTWMSWPKNPLTFPKDVLPKVEEAYADLLEALTSGERVDLLVDDEAMEDHVSSIVSRKRVTFHRIESADVWIRDYGPIFVRNARGGAQGVAATKWEFNAWGNKYDDLLMDDQTGTEVAKATGLKIFQTGVVLEGGSIDVNGKGSLLTTEQCLLNKNRNPSLGKARLEALLHDYLGVSRVIWLKNGIEGDDTDGHVDDIARFVRENTVVCMIEDDESDANHRALEKNVALLSSYEDANGRRLEVIPMSMPHEVKAEDGRLPASYANFLISNSAVLVPVFDDAKRDDDALETLRDLFRGRKIVPINSRELVYGFGGIHCVTQQQPSGA